MTDEIPLVPCVYHRDYPDSHKNPFCHHMKCRLQAEKEKKNHFSNKSMVNKDLLLD